MDNFGPASGQLPLRKTAFDVGTLTGMLPHVGLALGLHVGGNALLKPFLAGKMGGAAAQRALASKGFRHGASGRQLHPMVSDIVKQFASPEVMNSYEMGLKAGQTFAKKPLQATMGVAHAESQPLHHALGITLEGAKDGLKKIQEGYAGSRKGKLFDKFTVKDETVDKLTNNKAFGVARGAANLTTAGAAIMSGIPGIGDHVAVNTARTMMARTPKGKASVKNRVLEGAKGVPESKTKRRFLDYIISPGYGEARDIGHSLKPVLDRTGASEHLKDYSATRLENDIKSQFGKHAAFNPAMIIDDVFDIGIMGKRMLAQQKARESQQSRTGGPAQPVKQAGFSSEVLGPAIRGLVNSTVRNPVFLGLAGAGAVASMYGPKGLGGPEDPADRGKFSPKRALKSSMTWVAAGTPIYSLPASVRAVQSGNLNLASIGGGLGILGAGATLHSLGKSMYEDGSPSLEHNAGLRKAIGLGRMATTAGEVGSVVLDAYAEDRAMDIASTILDNVAANQA